MTNFGIVIATYMRPDGKTLQYLKRCLESIAKQKHSAYSVYLIGDRYENNAEFISIGNEIFTSEKLHKINLKIAKERDTYLGTNNKALWLYGGVNATNRGIDIALSHGHRYVCILDHDDWWEPDHLSNFNDLIKKTRAKFTCSMATHANGMVLPAIKTSDQYIKFVPARRQCIKSSCCVDMVSITCRFRDLYAIDQRCDVPADADYWSQVALSIKKHDYPSYAINRVTCHHDEEGYSKTIKPKK